MESTPIIEIHLVNNLQGSLTIFTQYRYLFGFNPDYTLGFVIAFPASGRKVWQIKSDRFQIHFSGGAENNKIATDFELLTGRNTFACSLCVLLSVSG
ncbi:hypothetical protein [Cyclobacterium sp.]|uniref:hypothetical protein n=1 Tax=Cyclobacterium sp. TaxID=1966343 RepID=UPI00198CA46F|nr:hypothetical protein [Cyclobacterium sp.]MBD3626907.1 hypothetical protein [Cyclobacterium sp.]